NLHENFHGGVFRVLTRGQRPPAKTEYSRGMFPVKLTPSLGIASPGSRDDLARLPCFRGIHRKRHPAWFLDVHMLVRFANRKNYTPGLTDRSHAKPLPPLARLVASTLPEPRGNSLRETAPKEEKAVPRQLEGLFVTDCRR